MFFKVVAVLGKIKRALRRDGGGDRGRYGCRGDADAIVPMRQKKVHHKKKIQRTENQNLFKQCAWGSPLFTDSVVLSNVLATFFNFLQELNLS